LKRTGTAPLVINRAMTLTKNKDGIYATEGGIEDIVRPMPLAFDRLNRPLGDYLYEGMQPACRCHVCN
jgi:hypothetical protein